jgi:hypothetical protein
LQVSGNTAGVVGTLTSHPLVFTAGNTERMRIDTSGNLALGSTSILGSTNRASFTNATSAKGVLAISNTSSSGYSAVELYDNAGGQQGAVGWGNGSVAATGAQNATYLYSSGAITFLSGGTTERARIDSSGQVLFNKTTTADTTVGSSIITNGRITSTMAEATNAQSTLHVYSTNAAAYRFYVSMNGTINATTTVISAISDIRFKENIRDLDVGLNKIMALKPRLYDWKEGKGADIKNARGFIAQEFEQVFPDLIDEWKDPAPEGEDPYKSVRADLIPVLVKAIQELKVLVDTQASTITSLTDRITALEAK